MAIRIHDLCEYSFNDVNRPVYDNPVCIIQYQTDTGLYQCETSNNNSNKAFKLRVSAYEC